MGKVFDAINKSRKKMVHTSGKKIRSEKKRKIEKAPPPPEPTDRDIQLPGLDKIHDKMVTLLKPHSTESEQFKILRTNLFFPVSGKPPRSIMITSPLPGEGKSFVSANLAVSIAHYIDKFVLLMDCDIRRPTIHTYFGLENIPGLSEYLSEGLPLPDLLYKTSVEKLTLFPGGNPPHNPSELLSSEKMAVLLQELKARFSDRYIIIDSPPPKLTAESNVIARQVDGVVIVIKYKSTPRDLVSELIESFGKEKIIGIILNNSEMGNMSKKYKRYYSRYF